MLVLHVGLLVFSHFVMSSQPDMIRNTTPVGLGEEQQNADYCTVLWPSWDLGEAEKRSVLVCRTGVVVRDGRMTGDSLLVVHRVVWGYLGFSLLAFQSRRVDSVVWEVHPMDPSSPWSVLVVPQREVVVEAVESDTHVLDPSWVFVDLDVRTVGGRDALMAGGLEDMEIQADAKMAMRDRELVLEEEVIASTRWCLAIVQEVVLLTADASDQALQYPS